MQRSHPDVVNFGDLTTIADPPPVDVVTAGFPCQPVSIIGNRKGLEDERWLIRDVVSVWQRSGARWLILENVPGLLSANDGEAFGQVVDSLAETGCVAEWAHFRADAVGAPHIRERWFCIASTDPGGLGRLRSGPEHRRPGRVGESESQDENRNPSADAVGITPERRGADSVLAGTARTEQEGRRDVLGGTSGGDGETDADTHGSRFEGVASVDSSEGRLEVGTRDDPDRCGLYRFGDYGPAINRWERIIGRTAPDPTIDGRLNVSFVEWMMGLPEGHVNDVDLFRKQKLRILGNGVVPHQAAEAIIRLTQGK